VRTPPVGAFIYSNESRLSRERIMSRNIGLSKEKPR
jgi:hypothetical protein